MNTSTPPYGHPDDETLSAALDGEDDEVVALHLAGCGSCGTRLADLRAVAVAVASPVAGPAGGAPLDDAIRAARRAWAAALADPVIAEPVTTAPRMTALAPPGTIPLDRARRHRPRGWVLGAAAAAVGVLGVASLAVSLGGGSGPGNDGGFAAGPPPGDRDSAIEGLMTEAAPAITDQESGAGDTALGSGTTVGDLGDFTDADAVADGIRPSLGSQRAMAAPATPAPGATTATDAVPSPCAVEAATAAGSISDQADSVASLRYRGEPAVVYAFVRSTPAPDGSVAGRVVVMAAAGCRLLGAADL